MCFVWTLEQATIISINSNLNDVGGITTEMKMFIAR